MRRQKFAEVRKARLHSCKVETLHKPASQGLILPVRSARLATTAINSFELMGFDR